jgi:ribonucleotide reductase alpha subunit
MTLVIFHEGEKRNLCNVEQHNHYQQHKKHIMSKSTPIYQQHEENREFTSKLDFYKDEIKILEGRLGELASKNSKSDILGELEKYQNQLIIQRNNIDEIAHKVKINEDALEREIDKNPVAVDHRHVPNHGAEKELVEGFETNFHSLRADLNGFISKWM